jgi:O-acetyl-ADP-ribose deacetylase (regulator of RNase III)
MLNYLTGDLLDLPNIDCIVQQCNCVTVRAKGLAQKIAEKYPYADVYTKRSPNRSLPGTVVYAEPDDNKNGNPIVACLMAQIAPSIPGSYVQVYQICPEDDTAAKRLQYFKQCLQDLSRETTQRNWNHIAFPCQIGCGLAGGDWRVYEAVIKDFVKSLPTSVNVSIVRFCKV